MDKQAEIRQEAARIKQEIKSLENQIEILQLQLKHLRATCDHPNQYRHNSWGEVGMYCPDCGRQT